MENNLKDLPIAVFDSGFGGLSVLKEIIKILPNENVIYFGDNGRAPYGTKSGETILKYAIDAMDFLIQKRVKLIAIACNTASAYAYNTLKNTYKIPILEVIEPASNMATKITKNNNIGIIGTSATINSNIYTKTIKNINEKVNVFSQACPMFVPLIEEGWINKDIAKDIVKEYLKYFDDKNIDTLILGCTHYPLIEKTISEYFDNRINLINSGEEVSKNVKNELENLDLINNENQNPVYKFYTSDDINKFKKLGSLFLEQEIVDIEKIEI